MTLEVVSPAGEGSVIIQVRTTRAGGDSGGRGGGQDRASADVQKVELRR